MTTHTDVHFCACGLFLQTEHSVVGLLVTTENRAKTAEPIEMMFGRQTRVAVA